MKRLAVFILLAACDSGSSANLDLNVTWSFDSGDCASNNVKTVHVSWGLSLGTMTSVDFDCADGKGKLGELSDMGGDYAITAEGRDSGGVARATGGLSLTVGTQGTHGDAVDISLHPKPSDIAVTWSFSSGGGCPPSVQLPYQLTLYKGAVTDGGMPMNEAQQTQVGCAVQMATFMSVVPGDYVVDLDDQAITPRVKGTKNVTVNAGQNASVDFQF